MRASSREPGNNYVHFFPQNLERSLDRLAQSLRRVLNRSRRSSRRQTPMSPSSDLDLSLSSTSLTRAEAAILLPRRQQPLQQGDSERKRAARNADAAAAVPLPTSPFPAQRQQKSGCKLCCDAVCRRKNSRMPRSIFLWFSSIFLRGAPACRHSIAQLYRYTFLCRPS